MAVRYSSSSWIYNSILADIWLNASKCRHRQIRKCVILLIPNEKSMTYVQYSHKGQFSYDIVLDDVVSTHARFQYIRPRLVGSLQRYNTYLP